MKKILFISIAALAVVISGCSTKSTSVSGDSSVDSNRGSGGAWLSSARVVRCWVKSRNERNPRI